MKSCRNGVNFIRLAPMITHKFVTQKCGSYWVTLTDEIMQP